MKGYADAGRIVRDRRRYIVDWPIDGAAMGRGSSNEVARLPRGIDRLHCNRDLILPERISRHQLTPNEKLTMRLPMASPTSISIVMSPELPAGAAGSKVNHRRFVSADGYFCQPRTALAGCRSPLNDRMEE